MAGDEGRLGFSVALDTRALSEGVAEARRVLRGVGDAAEKEGERTDTAMRRLKSVAAGAFSMHAAAGFAREVISVRKEIVSLEASLRQLAGGGRAAEGLMRGLRDFYGSQAPLDFKDIAAGAQTMMGFGIAAEDTLPVLRAIGDISMGNSERFGALALAFSQASSTGKLMGQDLMQMINAGFNPLAQIAEATGRSIGELKDQMAQGGISAQMLRDAFIGAAAEGGRYHGMLAAQGEGLAGSIAGLQAAYTDMLNSIGDASEGVIGSLADGATHLLKHYKAVGAVLGGVVAAYGFKQAAQAAAKALSNAGEIAGLRAESAALEGLIGTQERAQLVRAGLKEGTKEHMLAVRRLAAEQVKGAQVELARARAAVKASAETTAARRAEFRAARARETAALQELQTARGGGNDRAIEAAQRRALAATTARQTAAQEVLTAARGHEARQTAAQTAARKAAALAAATETAASKGAAAATGKLAQAKALAARTASRLGKVIASNAYLAAAAAAMALIYAIRKLVTHQTDAARAQARLNKAFEGGEAAAAAEMAKVDALFDTLKGAAKGTREYEAARGAIISQYGEYLKGLGDEEAALSNVAAAYEAVAAGVMKAARTKAKEAYIAEESEEYAKALEEGVGKLQKKFVKRFGEAEGRALLAQIKEVIEGHKTLDELSAEAREKVKSFEKDQVVYGHAATGKKVNPIIDTLKELQKSKTLLKNALADAEEIFGESAAARPTDLAGWQARLQALRAQYDALSDLQKKEAHGLAIQRDIEEALRVIGELSKPPVQNKAYWEARKDAAEKELAALSAEAAVGEEGAEARRKYNEAADALRAYDMGGSRGGSGGAEAAARQAREAAEALRRLEEKEAEAERRAQLAIREAAVDGMQEGFAKEMAAAQLNHERMRAANARRREEMVADEQERLRVLGKHFEAENFTAAQLPETKRAQLAAYDKIADDELARAQRAALAKVMDEVMIYQQRRLEVETEYAAKRRALYEADGATLRAGVTEGNVEELHRKQEEALAEVDSQFAEREATYRSWLATLSAYTLDGLRAALAEAESALAELKKAGGGEGNQLAVARAQVAKLKEAIASTEAARGAGSPQKSAKEWEALRGTLAEAKRGFEALGDAVGGTVGKMLKGAGEIIGLVDGAIGGIQQLVEASSAAMVASARTAAGALSAVEKGSLILGVLSAALKIGMKLASLFNSTKALDREIARQDARLQALTWELDNSATAELWRKEGAEIARTLQEAMAAGRNLIVTEDLRRKKLISREEARKVMMNYEAAVEKGVKALQTKFAGLSYTAANVFGPETYAQPARELENISRQIAARQQQIQAEGGKGKKRDENKMAQWDRETKELARRAAEVRRQALESIVGGSATDLAGQLGDALVEAFRAGEDAAEAWGKKVDDIVANMLKKMLIKQFLEKPVAQLMDKFQRQVTNANGSINVARLEGAARDFHAGLDSLTNGAMRQMFEAMERHRDVLNGASAAAARGATAKGIATASQDSVDELNGRITVMQTHTYALVEGNRVLQATCGGILESVRGIEGTSARIEQRLSGVEGDVRKIRRAFEDAASGGLRVKG